MSTLPENITPGGTGHVAHHQLLHDFVNDVTDTAVDGDTVVYQSGGYTNVPAVGMDAADFATMTTGDIVVWDGNSLIPVNAPADFTPVDHGFYAWSLSPTDIVDSNRTVNGVLHMATVRLLVPRTITSIVIYVVDAGVNLNNGWAGIYSTAGGAPLRSTAQQSSALMGTGEVTLPLSSTLSLAAGDYPIGILANGVAAQGPGLAKGALGPWNNIGINTAAAARFATYGGGQTALPSVTMASRTVSSLSYWVALK